MAKPLTLPLRGLSDLLGAESQEKETTKRAKNVSELDPQELSVGGIAQRGGQIKHTATQLIAGTKVSHLCDIVYDNPSHTFANLLSAACTVEWSSTGANRSEAYAGVRDDLGNFYYVDGAASIVKVNPSGRQIWNLPLPSAEPNAIVRAIAIDLAGRIYAGVSAGVEPEKARIWCFEPREEGKPPELLWTLGSAEEPLDWLTEELHISGTILSASQNNPITRQSRMALYSGVGLNQPTLIREWPIPYGVNGHHVSPKDGSVFTAHGPDDRRTFDPRSPETTGSREDWTPRNLDNFAQRAWSWTDADDVDGGGLGNGDYEVGEVIDTIVDKTGNGRGWVVRSGDTGGVLRKGGIAGHDSIYLNGTSNSYAGEAPVSINRDFRQLNRSVLPCYTKAQFVVFMVLRIPQEAQMRLILANAATSSANRVLMQNGGTRVGGAGGVQTSEGTVSVFENTTQGTASGPSYDANPSVLPGGFDNSGLVLLTWIHDGGYDDVASVPTRSTFRVNGRPCDRWTSDDIFASLLPTYLGKAVNGSADFTAMPRMMGDFCEMLVLSDWYTAGFADTSPLTQQRLITTPIYPDAVWAADGDTELERLEGYFAHKWGFAHKLPTGQAAVLENVTTPNNNDTVTIDTVVYTFKTVLTAAARDVLIGGNATNAFRNLHHAINASGEPGTDYSAATTAHPTVWSPAFLFNTDTTPHTAVLVQRRDPRVYATFAVAESSATARQDWISGATSISSRNGSGENVGHYPHSFFLFRAMGTTGSGTPLSRGGPPRSNAIGVTFPSVVGALISPYGMLAKWDPANGKCRNVLTTDGPGFSFLGVGGVGYGVRVLSDGSVVSIGPRQAAVSGVIPSADNIDVRKVWDKGAEDTTAGGFVTTLGTTSVLAWEAQPGAQTYAYPRMDVDEWDNVYVPLYQSSNGSSLAVYAKLGASAVTPNADVLLTLQSLTDDPRAYAVLIDPDSPKYPHAYSKPRAERVLLLTERVTSASNFTVLHMVRIVSATQSNVAVRAQKRLAVCGAALYDITTPATPMVIDAAAFSSTARFIDGCEFGGVRVWTDGNTYRTYDPRTGVFGYLRSRSSGEIPKRGRLMARYVNRLWIAGFEDFPERAAASVAGDLYGWDFDPPGEAPLPVAAYRSDLTTSGDFPDQFMGLAPWRDDLMYLLGARNVFMLRGDPLQGGRFDTVVKGQGAAFGRAHCFTPAGRFYWITNEAELWYMPVGGGEGSARSAGDRIAKRLQDAIDFSVCQPELIWDPRLRRIDILLMPTGVGNTLFRHFVLSFARYSEGAFWEESYGHVDVQPTAVMIADGDAGADRRKLFGSRDGYVREWSATAPGDDGLRIDSECLIAPIHEGGVEAELSNVEVLLARAQGGARIELYATDEPDDLGDLCASASLLPGRNTPVDLRQTGAYLGLLLTGETGVERFSVRHVMADVRLSGPVRARGR